LWTAIVLTGTSQWLNEATAIAPINAAWKAWLKEAEGQVQPKLKDGKGAGRHLDEWDGRFRIHRRPRIGTGSNWTFTPANKFDPTWASSQRRIRIKSWAYQKRLTEILKEHAATTRVPIEDEYEDIEEPSDVIGSSSNKPNSVEKTIMEV
jgi:hypothetical protein